jgi:hypothetical protein
MTRSYVFGDSLAELRTAAYTWLFQHQPSCFSNTNPDPTHYGPGMSSSTSLLAIYQVKSLALDPPPSAKMQAVPPTSQNRPDTGIKGTSEQIEGTKKKRNHQRSRRGQKFTPLGAPPLGYSETEAEQDRDVEAAQTIDKVDECSTEDQAQLAQDERATQETVFPTPMSVQPTWCRIAPGGVPLLPFKQVTHAVMHFIEHDILPERGPDYVDEEINAQREELLIHRIKTVKVIDDENIANNMLQRGGWHLFKIIGKLAPARGSAGLVLFILGHIEEHAV